jgi:hypothetical protein
MRFRIRTAVVENSFHIKYYKVNINSISNKDASSGKLYVFYYFKVNKIALSHKDSGGGKHIIYYLPKN